MEVIKNNINVIKEKAPIRCTCEYCMSVVDVEEDDIMFEDGMKFFECPCCHEASFSEELQGFPTKDEVEFPKYFYHFKAIDIGDDRINKWIQECINLLENSNDDSHYASIASGNTLVVVVKNIKNKEYTVTVCKNYYEAVVKMGD